MVLIPVVKLLFRRDGLLSAGIINARGVLPRSLIIAPLRILVNGNAGSETKPSTTPIIMSLWVFMRMWRSRPNNRRVKCLTVCYCERTKSPLERPKAHLAAIVWSFAADCVPSGRDVILVIMSLLGAGGGVGKRGWKTERKRKETGFLDCHTIFCSRRWQNSKNQEGMNEFCVRNWVIA